MNQDTRLRYNANNAINLMNHRYNQGPVIDEDDEFAAYISSFEDNVKLPMENHLFFQER